MKRLLSLACLVTFVAACGSSSSSPSSPTPTPAPTPTPTPTTFTLSGTVSSTAGGGISGATVRVVDGTNAGRSVTTGAGGTYTVPTLAVSGMTVNASAANFSASSQGVTLTSSQTVNFQLAPIPLFSRSGTGDTVFDMPTTVSRVRITAAPRTSCQNFAVQIAGRLIVNVILGTCSVADSRTHDGTYLTSGGVVQITISSGIDWNFTEVR